MSDGDRIQDGYDNGVRCWLVPGRRETAESADVACDEYFADPDEWVEHVESDHPQEVDR